MLMFTTPTKTLNVNFDLDKIKSQFLEHLPHATEMGEDNYLKINYDFADLNEELKHVVYNFLFELGYDGDYEIQSWGNYYKTKTYGGKHDHLRRDVILSGILYVEPLDGMTRFFDPMAQWHDQFGYWNIRKGKHEHIGKPNEILLFPPYLVHDVVMHTEGKRMTIAFDVVVK